MQQKLALRQGQSLLMTPQLQQAIKLLQMSNLDLSQYVDAEIEANPLLERAPEEDKPKLQNLDEPGPDGTWEPSEGEIAFDTGHALHAAGHALDAPIEDISHGDTGSDMIGTASPMMSHDRQTHLQHTDSSNFYDGESQAYHASTHSGLSLQEHLATQLQMARLNTDDALIASRLIHETGEDGYCRANLEELAESFGTGQETILHILRLCQNFEPTGIMARSVSECLGLQLAERNRLDPAMQTLLENLELVAKQDIAQLMTLCQLGQDDIEDMLAELKTLTPRPGEAFASDISVAIEPDVFVHVLPDTGYAVELNTSTLPRVLMNQVYYSEISTTPLAEADREFISQCAANANWLIKSLNQRAETVLKVCKEIVREQDAFLAQGIAHLRPLTLDKIAKTINVHESTVSRVTANKYMATPRGLFELKYFFTAAISGLGSGAAHSAEAVRFHIKTLIKEEEAENAVLSDDQLVQKLRDLEIDISRRTVAKYREALNIPSSFQRRRQYKSKRAIGLAKNIG